LCSGKNLKKILQKVNEREEKNGRGSVDECDLHNSIPSCLDIQLTPKTYTSGQAACNATGFDIRFEHKTATTRSSSQHP
jgi:hypothetical protein